MKFPKPGDSLNVLSLKRSAFPERNVPLIGGAIARVGGIEIGEETFLVPGDYMGWFVFLTEMGGEDIKSFKLYSLSAVHSGMDGLQPRVREMAIRHLRSELELIGLEVPDDLKAG